MPTACAPFSLHVAGRLAHTVPWGFQELKLNDCHEGEVLRVFAARLVGEA